MPLTEKDLKDIARTVDDVTAPQFQDISTRLKNVEKNIGQLTTTVDNFAHIVRRHEDEWLVLRAQHEKIRDILVNPAPRLRARTHCGVQGRPDSRGLRVITLRGERSVSPRATSRDFPWGWVKKGIVSEEDLAIA